MKLCIGYTTSLGSFHYEIPKDYTSFDSAALEAARNLADGTFYFKNIHGAYIAMRADKVDFVEVVTVDDLVAHVREAGEEVPGLLQEVA